MHELICRPHLEDERGTKDSRSKHPSERESRYVSLKTSTSHILYHLGYYIITKDTVRNLNQRKWKRYCVCKLQRTRKQKRDFLLGMMIYRAMWRQCSHMLTTMHTKLQIQPTRNRSCRSKTHKHKQRLYCVP